MFTSYNAKLLIIQFMSLSNALLTQHYDHHHQSRNFFYSPRFLIELFLFNPKDEVFYGLSSKYFDKESPYYLYQRKNLSKNTKNNEEDEEKDENREELDFDTFSGGEHDRITRELLEKFDYFLALEGILGKCFEVKKTIIYYYPLPSSSSSANEAEELKKKSAKIVRYVLIPLISTKSNELIGVLQFINKNPPPPAAPAPSKSSSNNKTGATNNTTAGGASSDFFLNHFNINSYEIYQSPANYTNKPKSSSSSSSFLFQNPPLPTSSSSNKIAFHHLNNSLFDVLSFFLQFSIPILENISFFILLEHLIELYARYYLTASFYYSVQNRSYHRAHYMEGIAGIIGGGQTDVNDDDDDDDDDDDGRGHRVHEKETKKKLLSKIALITSPTKRKEMIENNLFQQFSSRWKIGNYYSYHSDLQQQTILSLLKSSEELLLSFPTIDDAIQEFMKQQKLEKLKEKQEKSEKSSKPAVSSPSSRAKKDKDKDNKPQQQPQRRPSGHSAGDWHEEEEAPSLIGAASRPIYPFSRRSTQQPSSRGRRDDDSDSFLDSEAEERMILERKRQKDQIIREEINLLDRLNSKITGDAANNKRQPSRPAGTGGVGVSGKKGFDISELTIDADFSSSHHQKDQHHRRDGAGDQESSTNSSMEGISFDLPEDFEMTPELQQLIQEILTTHRSSSLQQQSDNNNIGDDNTPSSPLAERKFSDDEDDHDQQEDDHQNNKKNKKKHLNRNNNTHNHSAKDTERNQEEIEKTAAAAELSPIGMKLINLSLQEQLIKQENQSFLLQKEILLLQKVIKYFHKYQRSSYQYYLSIQKNQKQLKDENILLQQDKEILMKSVKELSKKIR
jgi:hypothetical protein